MAADEGAKQPGGDVGRVLSLRVPARAEQLRRIRDAVRECVKGCGCDSETAADIVLAVDEACQNIIRHAYGGDPDGAIALEIEHRDDELVFLLRDFAPKIDPAQLKARDLGDVRPGGLGIPLIRKLMDRADFIPPPSGSGNLLRMVKRIP